MDRQLVQISKEQLQKIKDIDSLRPDLAGYPVSKKVAFLLHEKLAETYLKKDSVFRKNSGKGKWLEYIREVVPLHVLAPIMTGMVNYSKDQIGEPFTKSLASNDSQKTWWLNYEDDILNVGKFLIKNLSDKNFSREYYSHYQEFCSEIKIKSEKVRKSSFSKLSNQRLILEYNSFFDSVMHFHALTLDIDAIDIMVEKAIKDELKNLYPDLGERELILKYNTLVTPIGLSYVTEEQIMLYNLAKLVIESGAKDIFDYDNKIIEEKIQKYPKIYSGINAIVEKYWWTSLGWSTTGTKTFSFVVCDLKNVLREGKDIDGEILRMTEFPRVALMKRKEELKIKKSNTLLALLDIFDNYFHFHDLRKEIQMRTTFSLNLFLMEASIRTNKKFSDLIWMWPSEVEYLIKTGYFDLEKILARKESMFILVSKEGIEELTGEAAALRRKQEISSDTQNTHDFRGVPASMGRVIGNAKVCYSAADALAKIEKGDILVASMTMPDFVPAMKKAGAIVTDEGGITSHAAIIARELKIPCIVGAKIATKVLNDGDHVEVNANHAVVTILKKFSK